MPNATEELLNSLGNLLAEDTEYPLDETLLYAEVEGGYVRPSIFKGRSNSVVYRRPDLDTICGPLTALWEAAPADKRWAEIEYLIRDGRFTATYAYPDEIDPDEEPLDRRRRIVARYFGDKPIVYPPKDGLSAGQTFTL
jgi:hypothetical protein